MADYICPITQISCGATPAGWCDGCQCPQALGDDDPIPPIGVRNAPDRIWMCVGDLEATSDWDELTSHDDSVTWCSTPQDRYDVEYVRADLLAGLLRLRTAATAMVLALDAGNVEAFSEMRAQGMTVAQISDVGAEVFRRLEVLRGELA